METIKITWTDSATPGVIGHKIYRDDNQIGDVGMGVEIWEDTTAMPDVYYKYEVQAYNEIGQTEAEVEGVNMDYIEVATTQPTTLKPIMMNFRVEDATPKLIHFDTPLGPVTGVTSDQFFVTGRTVSAINTVDNYLTVSVALNHWSNHTVRKVSGSEVGCYDFDLQYTTNNIVRPATPNDKYVTEGGSGSGTQGSPWSLSQACSNAQAGDHVYIQKGTYPGTYTVNNSGQVDSPIIFEGYDTTPGDRPTLVRTPTTVLDDSVMPYLDGSGGVGFYTDNNNYIVVSNMCGEGYDRAFRLGNLPTGVVFDNVYARGSQAFGVATIEGYAKNSTDCRVINSYASDTPSMGIRTGGERSLQDNNYVCSNGVVSMDYYISHQGSSIGTGDGIIRNCEIFRDTADSHSGHGISLRGNGIKVENTLVEGCQLDYVASAIELRTDWVQYCVVRDCVVNNHGETDWTYQAIRITGARNNTIDHLVSIDNEYFVQFIGSTESEEYGVIPVDTGYNNTFKNCIGYRTLAGTSTQIVINNESKAGASRSPQYNTFVNCTFSDFNRAVYYTNDSNIVNDPDVGNEFKNCIINNVPTEQVNGTNQSSQWAYNYCDNWNSFTPSLGANNFEVDPDLDIDGVPQATFTDIDVPADPRVPYDADDLQRAEDTTVGWKKSPEETVGLPPEPDENLVKNGEFVDGGLHWDIGGGTSAILNEEATIASTGGSYTYLKQEGILPLGETITVEYLVRSTNGVNLTVDDDSIIWDTATTGTKSQVITAQSVDLTFKRIVGTDVTNVVLDDISAKVDSTLLFKSGFGGTVTVSDVILSNPESGRQDITGTDGGGYTWDRGIVPEWCDNQEPYFNNIHLIFGASDPQDLLINEIETVQGHDGTSTQALAVSRYHDPNSIYGAPASQTPYQINRPECIPGKSYQRMWIKLDGMQNMLDLNTDSLMFWQYKSENLVINPDNDPWGVRMSLYLVGNDEKVWWYIKFDTGFEVDGNDPTLWIINTFDDADPTAGVNFDGWNLFEIEVTYSKVDTGGVVFKLNGVEVLKKTDTFTLAPEDTNLQFITFWQYYGNYNGTYWLDYVELHSSDPLLPFINATSISVTDTATVGIGYSTQLVAEVLPSNASNKYTHWTSSDEAIATVDDFGLVTGVTSGSATITGRSDDGDFTDTSVITVQ